MNALLRAPILMVLILLWSHNNQAQQQATNEPEILYWVAPMDPNYRRDQPGKSPMGMDLVPVYASSDNGTLQINPAVVNNIGVKTHAAFVGRLQPEIRTVGVLRYSEEHIVHIHPRVEGWVEKLYIKANGEMVSKGQALYALYSPELVAAQEEFLLVLARDNERLIPAAKRRLRALKLSDAFIDRLSATRQVQQQVTFYAAQNGVVENLAIREGFFVEPGTTLMAIASIEPLWLDAEVFAEQSKWLSSGAKVSIYFDYLPGESWQGKIDYIYPDIDPVSRAIKVRIVLLNPQQKLRANMFAEVHIDAKSTRETLLVDKQAVIQTAKDNRVLLSLGDGKFETRQVLIGASDGQYRQILSGLNAGDKVVTSGQFLIDSEANKFTAMNRFDAAKNSIDKATVTGVIKAVDKKNRQVSVYREAIEKWQRPAALVNFTLADSVNISLLEKGTEIEFSFSIIDRQFVITSLLAINQGGEQ